MDLTRLLFLLSILLLAIAIGTFIYRHSENSGAPQASPAVIVKLTRQAARWLVAAQQDESPMIAFLHLQYGMGYVWALSDVTTPESYKAATGQDWKLLENKAQMMQDQVTKRMVKACPQFAGDVDKYLGRLAGDI